MRRHATPRRRTCPRARMRRPPRSAAAPTARGCGTTPARPLDLAAAEEHARAVVAGDDPSVHVGPRRRSPPRAKCASASSIRPRTTASKPRPTSAIASRPAVAELAELRDRFVQLRLCLVDVEVGELQPRRRARGQRHRRGILVTALGEQPHAFAESGDDLLRRALPHLAPQREEPRGRARVLRDRAAPCRAARASTAAPR